MFAWVSFWVICFDFPISYPCSHSSLGDVHCGTRKDVCGGVGFGGVCTGG